MPKEEGAQCLCERTFASQLCYVSCRRSIAYECVRGYVPKSKHKTVGQLVEWKDGGAGVMWDPDRLTLISHLVRLLKQQGTQLIKFMVITNRGCLPSEGKGHEM